MMTEEMNNIEIFQKNYDQKRTLGKCEDIILEAKRVLLNEQLEKIANITLSEVHNSRTNIENCIKYCKDTSNWENKIFWEELPHPKKSLNNVKNAPNNQKENDINIDIDDLMKIHTQKILKSNGQIHNKWLVDKYFNIWKKSVKMKKEKSELLKNKEDQKEKLEKFIKRLKKCKKREQEKCSGETESKAISKQIKPTNNYKNRFDAQKNIIDIQKAKLDEQNKIIEELQLGIIREDLLKSITNSKTNIREIFKNCSEKIKCKVPIVFLEEKEQFMINSQKAPKVIQQMEQRALQRAQNRQIILERKRLIEDARQQMLEEAIENKRVMEEEEKRRNLEAIKERRKKEFELEKIRQAKKQKYLQNLNKAINYHNKLLTVQCFKILYDNFRESRKNEILARNHYETKIIQKSIYCWFDYIEDKYRLKYQIANAHFAYKILKRTLKMWHDDHIENVRNMQVAEDFFDFRLTSNIFIHWHRYMYFQSILQQKKSKTADIHYNRRILFLYFYLWRSLPAVLQLEKAKELKKRKWREKVWEILPDYKPPEDI